MATTMLTIPGTGWPLQVIGILETLDLTATMLGRPAPTLHVHLGATAGQVGPPADKVLHTDRDCVGLLTLPTGQTTLADWFARADSTRDLTSIGPCEHCAQTLTDLAAPLGEDPPYLFTRWLGDSLEELSGIGAPVWAPRVGSQAPTASSPGHHLGGSSLPQTLSKLATIAHLHVQGRHLVTPMLRRLRSEHSQRAVAAEVMAAVVDEVCGRLHEALDSAKNAGVTRLGVHQTVSKAAQVHQMENSRNGGDRDPYRVLFTDEEYQLLDQYRTWVQAREHSRGGTGSTARPPCTPAQLDRICDSGQDRSWVLVDLREVAEWRTELMITLLHAEESVAFPDPVRAAAVAGLMFVRVPTKLAYRTSSSEATQAQWLCGPDRGYTVSTIREVAGLLDRQPPATVVERFSATADGLTAACI